MQIFATILSVLGFGFLFLAAGRGILSFIFRDYKAFPASMKYGLGYFLGMAGFLAAWRLLESIFSSSAVAFWLSSVFMIFLSAYFIWKRGLGIERPNYRKIFFASLLFIFVLAFEFALWLQVLPTPRDPFDNFGSAHPVRYANIAEYIFRAGDIPVLNQNFAQSLLAAIPRFFGAAVPFLALNLWLGISIFTLIIAVYGLFQHWGLKKGSAAFATFLFMMANTALSFTHVLSLDSNNPFLMSSYTDATAGIATFFVFLLVLLALIKSEFSSWKNWFFIPAVFGVYWSFSGGQNIILAAALLIVLCAWHLYRHKNFKNSIFVFAATFGVFSLLGSSQGGMLTPKLFRDRISLPGLAGVNREGEYSGIKPELPFAVGLSRNWEYGNPYDPAEKEVYVQVIKGKTAISASMLHRMIWRLESNAWVAVRVAFFPLLGLVMFGLFKKFFTQDLQRLWNFAIWIFATGFAFAFGIIISGRKWEMSRFMILPYALGLMFFILWISFIRQKINSSLRARILEIFVALVMTVGPIVNAAVIIYDNFKNPSLDEKKISFFFQNPGIYGREVWQEWIEKGLVKEE